MGATLENAISNIDSTLTEIIHRYPSGLVPKYKAMSGRTAFHVALVGGTKKGFEASLCDVGAGIGPMTVTSAAMGMKVTVVDDFLDAINEQYGDSLLDLLRTAGITVVQRDVVQDGLDFPPSTFDVVTCFDSLE